MRNTLAALPVAIALLGGVALPESSVPANARSASLNVPAPVAASRFAIHFLDVGTGDATIIDIGETEIVIDGGDSLPVLTDYVNRTGVVDGPIELVVVTHGDRDHWKGLTRLLGFDGKNPSPPTVLEFWEPGYNRDCRPLDSYDTFISNVENLTELRSFRRPLQNTYEPAVQSHRVDVIHLPGVPDLDVSVLHSESHPQSSNNDCAYLINNASIVLSARLFNHRFLFTGDANGKERDEGSPGTPSNVEKMLLELDDTIPGTLVSQVLKAPHHGSETASTQAFIDRVNPDFVVVSASTRHELPRDSTMRRYDDGQRVILRTDVDRRAGVDNIICYEDEVRELDCNYETALVEETAAVRRTSASPPIATAAGRTGEWSLSALFGWFHAAVAPISAVLSLRH